ncbi:hypothetical protein NSQ20_12215 [Paenibacillus sp. FSL K6-1122]|uniref:hypothetical protein n=1 Tax=Paenibacillus sp. FSL K6-1122 TaxID=2954512 RepID=UPI0030ED99C7
MGSKVIVRDASIWKEAVGKSGKIKGNPIRLSNGEELFLVSFDDRETDELSKSYGGFTFKKDDLEFK